MQKRCGKCKVVKDVSEFSHDRSKKDGLRYVCKACDVKHSREYNKEHKNEKAEYQREYQKSNKARIAKQQREYRKKHESEIVEYQRKYFKTDNGRMVRKRSNHNRRAVQNELGASITLKQWTFILAKQNNRCNNCGKKFYQRLSPTMDHIIPLSRGGLSTSDNIQALCRSCNSGKHAKIDLQYIQVWNV